MVIYGHENLLFNLGEGKDQLAYYIHCFFNRNGILQEKEFIQFLFDDILSDEQKEQMKELRIAHQKDTKELKNELEEIRLKQKHLMTACMK